MTLQLSLENYHLKTIIWKLSAGNYYLRSWEAFGCAFVLAWLDGSTSTALEEQEDKEELLLLTVGMVGMDVGGALAFDFCISMAAA